MKKAIILLMMLFAFTTFVDAECDHYSFSVVENNNPDGQQPKGKTIKGKRVKKSKTSKSKTSKSKTSKNRTSKSRTSKSRTSKSKTDKTKPTKVKTSKSKTVSEPKTYSFSLGGGIGGYFNTEKNGNSIWGPLLIDGFGKFGLHGTFQTNWDHFSLEILSSPMFLIGYHDLVKEKEKDFEGIKADKRIAIPLEFRGYVGGNSLKLFAGIEPKYNCVTNVDDSIRSTSHEVNVNLKAGINIGSMGGTYRLLIGGKYCIPIYDSAAKSYDPDNSNWICSFDNNTWQGMVHIIKKTEKGNHFKICIDFGKIKNIYIDKTYTNWDISIYWAKKFTIK